MICIAKLTLSMASSLEDRELSEQAYITFSTINWIVLGALLPVKNSSISPELCRLPVHDVNGESTAFLPAEASLA
jgi:hypothetical protein